MIHKEKRNKHKTHAEMSFLRKKHFLLRNRIDLKRRDDNRFRWRRFCFLSVLYVLIQTINV